MLAADAPMVSPLRPVPREQRDSPIVWVLADDKLGHTTQSMGLAEALGWAYATKELRFNVLNRLSNRLIGASLLALDRRRSTALLPPWPDLVIATGRRTAPVARWIAAQNGGRTRLVQLGRKGATRAEDFDLSVTCSHFAMPSHPRRMETLAPLTAIDERRLAAAGARWHDLFGSAPHPHVALLVGGSSALHRLDTDTAARMGRDLVDFVRATGGTLFVVTSPRTGAAASAALRAATEGAGPCYEWRAGDADNPYLGCLAVADALVVTGDSESMVAEAAATTKPLYIYPLPPRGTGPRQRLRAWVSRHARRPHGPARGGPLQRLCDHLVERGLVHVHRDVLAMHRSLIECGRAYAFGAPLDTGHHTPLRELDRVADRVRILLGSASPDTAH